MRGRKHISFPNKPSKPSEQPNMGATTSVVNLPIYLSAGKKTDLLPALRSKLKEIGLEVHENELRSITNTAYFIMCIDRDTTKNYNQIQEMNEAYDLQKPIIYVMMDPKYNHGTHPEIEAAFPLEHTTLCIDKAFLEGASGKIKELLRG
jgi:hypothetical protein